MADFSTFMACSHTHWAFLAASIVYFASTTNARVYVGHGLDSVCIRCVLNFCTRFLCCLQPSTLRDSLIQGEVYYLEKLLDCVGKETFDYLVSEGFLQAVVIAEIAYLGELTE